MPIVKKRSEIKKYGSLEQRYLDILYIFIYDCIYKYAIIYCIATTTALHATTLTLLHCHYYLHYCVVTTSYCTAFPLLLTVLHYNYYLQYCIVTATCPTYSTAL